MRTARDVPTPLLCRNNIISRITICSAQPPTTTEGIEKYLGSGMIRGIGLIYAKKLVRAFGDAVFDVIEQEPGRLREVTGIGPKRAERIVGAVALRNEALNCTPWVRSLTQVPLAWTNSPAAIIAA